MLTIVPKEDSHPSANCGEINEICTFHGKNIEENLHDMNCPFALKNPHARQQRMLIQNLGETPNVCIFAEIAIIICRHCEQLENMFNSNILQSEEKTGLVEAEPRPRLQLEYARRTRLLELGARY